MNDLLGVTLPVIDALDACGIRYTIGGSLASSFSGEPRASINVDIVVDSIKPSGRATWNCTWNQASS